MVCSFPSMTDFVSHHMLRSSDPVETSSESKYAGSRILVWFEAMLMTQRAPASFSFAENGRTWYINIRERRSHAHTPRFSSVSYLYLTDIYTTDFCSSTMSLSPSYVSMIPI